MRLLLAIALAGLVITAAYAVDQRLYVPGLVPPIGGTGLDQLLIPNQGGGGPPAGCNGTIDLSSGCVMPMLR